MSVTPPQSPSVRPRRRIPVTTWIGVGGTALLALIGFASTGFWGMVMLIALVLLPTVLYGVAFRRTTWLRLPRKRAVAGIGVGVAFVVLIGSTAAFGATHPELAVSATSTSATTTPHASSDPTRKPRALVAPSTQTPTPTPTPTPVVLTRQETETVAVPFSSRTVEDATIPQGQTSVTTAGSDGVQTKVWRITTTDGVETGRTLVSEAVTTPPTTQVTTNGTYVAPPAPAPVPAPDTCANGSYVNSAGNSVCRPQAGPVAPAGATAQCSDGTYSFSQSRRGTCSRHGGVASWL